MVLALAGAACGGSNETSNDGGAGGGGNVSSETLVIDRDMDINSLDPERAYCDTCQIFLTATYETLIGLDPTDNKTLVPRLATSWESNDDQTQFTFELDPAATFSDGSPVEAEDVKFSWERLAGLQGSASYLAAGISSIETPDARTVVANFDEPNSAFLAVVNASYMGVVNSAVAIEQDATTDATTDKAEEWFLANSAGSGPFVLESYAQGDELRLTRNDRYWGDKAGYAAVIMKQTKDAVTQRQQLEAGTADIAMQISNDVATDMNADGVTVEKVPSFNFVYLALSPGAKDNEVPLTPEVREAIRKALDYDGLIDVTVGGSGEKQASPIPNGFLGSADLDLPQQDVDGARQLLEDAGLADGFQIEATYPSINVYGVDFGTLMQKVQSDLGEVGIDVTLSPAELSVWADKITTDGIPLTALYFAPDHTDSSQYVQYFGLLDGSQWQTWTGEPASEEETSLLADALAAKDEGDREDIYTQLGQAMIDDGLIIPVVNPQLFLAYNSDIEGMAYSACCNLELGLLRPKG